jgi:putative acetyltransferase
MQPTIRLARKEDIPAIRQLNLVAFDPSERELIADLAVKMFSSPPEPPTFAYIAEIDGALCGHCAFSPLWVRSPTPLTAYSLAPLSVHPDHQRKGIGSNLIHRGIEHLRREGVDLLWVYGDPDYYTRFGFSHTLGKALRPPYPLHYPHGWLGLNLSKVDLGESTLAVDCIPALRNPALW